MKMKIYVIACVVIIAFIVGCNKDNGPAPIPVASFEKDKKTVLVNEEISFTNASQDASSYLWSFGDGNTSSEENPKHTYNCGGTYIVRLDAISEEVGSITDTVWVNSDIRGVWLFDINWPDIKYENYPMEFFEDNTIKPLENYLSGVSEVLGNAINFIVYSSLNANLIEYTGTILGNTMSGTMESKNTGTKGTWKAKWIDAGESDNNILSFTIDQTIAKEGEKIQFTGVSGYNVLEWNWNFGDGHTSNEQNPEHTFDYYNYFTVWLSVTTDCGIISVSKNINVIAVVDENEVHSYKEVTIGNQTWMAEDLKETKFSDGTAIAHITEDSEWAKLLDNNVDAAYCYLNNNTNSEAKFYGALYTYAAALNACPAGWHLPSDEEWTELEEFIANDGHRNREGKALKGTYGWMDDGDGTDDYGFSARGGGYRRDDDGSFGYEFIQGRWWTSTESDDNNAFARRMKYDYDGITRYIGGYEKSSGLAVRCVKD